MTALSIRPARPEDADALGLVMYDAIHRGPSKYSRAQRLAWQTVPYAGAEWAAKLAAQQVWLAEEAGEILGFVSLTDAGYLDLAFVRGAAQGRGLLRQLCAPLLQAARSAGHARIWTHASLMAQPAFLALGFHVIRHESLPRAGQWLDRAEMEKPLR
jgi:putative acetyltransferase